MNRSSWRWSLVTVVIVGAVLFPLAWAVISSLTPESRLFQWPAAPRSDDVELSLRDFHAIPGGQVYTPVLAEVTVPNPSEVVRAIHEFLGLSPHPGSANFFRRKRINSSWKLDPVRPEDDDWLDSEALEGWSLWTRTN